MKLRFWKQEEQEKRAEPVIVQPVKKALETMQVVSTERVTKAQAAVVMLEERIDKNRALSASLTLGVEAEAKRRVDEETQKMEHELRQTQKFIDLSTKYRELSLVPLTWRCDKGFPLLAIYGLECPQMTIREEDQHEEAWKYSTREFRALGGLGELPPQIARCFASAGKLLPYDRQIESKFDAIVPAEIKKAIEAAKPDFDQVFIIAEATWRVRTDPDPLVVGWAADKLWLITSWDMTSIEQAMSFSLPERAYN